MKNGIFNVNQCIFCFILSVTNDFKEWFEINKQKEAEIVSSAYYLRIDRIFSLINQTNLTERRGCKGAKDESQPQNDLKKESGASDAVTSPTLYSLAHSATEEASDAH
jgi:hypothetical protein